MGSKLRRGCTISTRGVEELFVIASEVKILQPIAGVALIYCRIGYKFDLSNRHAIILQTW